MNSCKSINGWTIAHIISTVINELDAALTEKITLESSDARLNGEDFTAVGVLVWAKVGSTYALRFKQGCIIDAKCLQERKSR